MFRIQLRFVSVGVVVWFAFLVLIRLLGPTFFTWGNPLLLVLFILSLPILLATIFALSRLLGVPIREMPIPIMVITITALVLDGLVVGFTDFYGTTPDQIVAAAALLLWGAGAGMLISLWLANRPGAQA